MAQALHNLSWDQFEEGDHPAALAAIEEAVEHRRAVARNPYGIGVPELASSVGALAYFHAAVGDRPAAVARFEEALASYAGATLPLSASELRARSGIALDLAQSYEALGRTADALTAASEAAVIRRRLSEYGPGLYTEGYATSLRDVSTLHRRHDRRIQERIVLRHALLIHRRLARAGEAKSEGLAICLADLGSSYAASWPTADRAVAALTEAYELFLALSTGEPRQDENVAISCVNLARALLMTSRFPEAVRIADHEVRFRRRLMVADRDGQEWPLYSALLRLAEGLTMAGRPAAAWSVALDAEEICRELVDRPGRAPAQQALLLRGLARTVSLCGRHDVRLAARALEPARRAARLCRGLVDREPGRYQADLRLALATLVTVLTRLGRHAEAAEVQLRRGA